jgi:lipopolysaccharide biosynthesis regulator YciM
VLAGHRLRKRGDHAGALRAWDALRAQQPAAFLLVAPDYAASALACGQAVAAQATLADALQGMPAIELLQALETVDGSDAPHRLPRLLAHLSARPSLSAAQLLFSLAPQEWTEEARAALRDAVARAARPLRRYRCAVCGFEAQHYFWQCPGCLSWDSYPPQRIDSQ